MAGEIFILKKIRKIIFALMIFSIFAFVIFFAIEATRNNLLEDKKIEPLTTSFWVVVGVATLMILTSFILSKKIKSLRTNQTVEERQKEVQISSLKKQSDSLENELAKTKKDLARVQGEIEDLKESETKRNTELNQLKASFETTNKECNRLNKENTTRQETISLQQQELEQAHSQHSELKNVLKQKGQLIQSLQDANQDMVTETQRLESNIAQLNQEIQTGQEAISYHREELKQANSQLSELQDELKEKKLRIQKLEDAYQTRDAKLKEAQSHIQAPKSQEPNPESRVEKEVKKEINEFDEERLHKEEKLTEILLENKFVTEEALQKALNLKEKYGGNLLRFLLVNRDLRDDQLAECLTSEFKIPYLPLNTYDISDDVVELLPYEVIEEHWVVPVDKIENCLMVVMVDPFDKAAIKKIEGLTGCTVKVYTSLLSEIADRIRYFYKINIRGLDAEGNPVSPLYINKQASCGRERRRAVRFKAKLPVKVTYDGHTAKSNTEDICWDGLSFTLNQELPVSSTVTIELSISKSEDKQQAKSPVTAVAEVRRATPLENNNFMIGAKLLKISREELSGIIKRVSEESDLEE